MANLKYHMSGITSSSIDYFCLICESHLKSSNEAKSHMSKPVHLKNLQSIPHCDQFEPHKILKVKHGYFCKICNMLCPTVAKIKLHIQDKLHITNNGVMNLTRVGTTVVAYGNVQIGEQAWNGFNEQTCIICNTEFEDANIHKTAATHVINLVHKKVEFTSENNIYRQTDSDSFQCLTCNLELAMSTFNDHFKGSQHTINYQNCIAKTPLDDHNNNEHKNGTINTIKDNKKDEAPQKTPVVKKHEEEKCNNTAMEVEKRICETLNAKDYIITDIQGKLHCILCSMDLTETPPGHISTMHHQALTKMHKERVKNNYAMNIAKESEKPDTTQNKESKHQSAKTNADHSKILDSVEKFQKDDINVNFETNVASCKKCLQTLEFTFDAIQSHINGHNAQTEIKKESVTLTGTSSTGALKKGTLYSSPVKVKKDQMHVRASSMSSEDDDAISKLANEHKLTENPKNFNMQCERCKVFIPRAKKNILEHVNGRNHKSMIKPITNIEAQAIEPNQQIVQIPFPRKVGLQDFIHSLSLFETSLTKTVVINNEICISIHSFFLVREESLNDFECLVCVTKSRNSFNIDSHCDTADHRKLLSLVQLRLVPGEFIRVIRDQLHHCGYCNIVTENWMTMDEHLKTNSHLEHMNHSQSRLEQFKLLKQEEQENKIAFSVMMKHLDRNLRM